MKNLGGNPYKAIMVQSGTQIDPADLKIGGSAFAGRNNEINASSDADLVQRIGQFLTAANAGDIQVQRQTESVEAAAAKREVRVEALRAASNDPQKFQMLGEAVALQITETVARDGFARKFLQYADLNPGDIPEISIKEQQVMAVTAVSASEVRPIFMQDKRFIAPEFENKTLVKVTMRELNQTRRDLLDEAYNEGLAAVLTGEDAMWVRQANRCTTISNRVQGFATLSPQIFASLQHQLDQFGIPLAYALMASDLWVDIKGSYDTWGKILSPVHQYELLLQGHLGTIYGTPILTDAVRQAKQRVLSAGDIFLVGAAENHGGMTVRTNPIVEPVNDFGSGESVKGWFISQFTSMTIGNAKSVAKGQRL